MSLLLAVETSSNQNRVVFGRDGQPIFDSAQSSSCSSSKPLVEWISHGLTVIKAKPTEITGMAVNIGPGALTSVRAGVSFVNAFAFSLGVSIYPFNWFEIVANQTRKLTVLPVLCGVPANNDNAYVGLINGTSVEVMRFGPLAETVAKLSEGLPAVAVAGKIRHRLLSLLNRVEVFDTTIETPDANVLLELGYQVSSMGGASASQVSPLNDQSEMFYEPTGLRN